MAVGTLLSTASIIVLHLPPLHLTSHTGLGPQWAFSPFAQYAKTEMAADKSQLSSHSLGTLP